MAARDMSDGICHRQHCQPEGKSNAKKADSEGRKRGGEHGGAAAAKCQPGGAEKLRCRATCHVHGFSPLQFVTNQIRDRARSAICANNLQVDPPSAPSSIVLRFWSPVRSRNSAAALSDDLGTFDKTEPEPRQPIELTWIALTSGALECFDSSIAKLYCLLIVRSRFKLVHGEPGDFAIFDSLILPTLIAATCGPNVRSLRISRLLKTDRRLRFG